jgi:hypothetical protein
MVDEEVQDISKSTTGPTKLKHTSQNDPAFRADASQL